MFVLIVKIGVLCFTGWTQMFILICTVTFLFSLLRLVLYWITFICDVRIEWLLPCWRVWTVASVCSDCGWRLFCCHGLQLFMMLIMFLLVKLSLWFVILGQNVWCMSEWLLVFVIVINYALLWWIGLLGLWCWHEFFV